jgi:hypothetical protein
MGLVGPTRAQRGMALCWHIDVKSPNTMVAIYVRVRCVWVLAKRWQTTELRRAARRRECQSGRWLAVNTRMLETKAKVGDDGDFTRAE